MEQRRVAELLHLYRKRSFNTSLCSAWRLLTGMISCSELKIRISKLEVRESCRSLTFDSHLRCSRTCEFWILSMMWLCHAFTLLSEHLLMISLYMCICLQTNTHPFWPQCACTCAYSLKYSYCWFKKKRFVEFNYSMQQCDIISPVV